MNETSQGRICVMTNDMFGCDDKWDGEFKYFAVTHGQMSNEEQMNEDDRDGH